MKKDFPDKVVRKRGGSSFIKGTVIHEGRRVSGRIVRSVEFNLPQLLTIDVDMQYIIEAVVNKMSYFENKDAEREKVLTDLIFNNGVHEGEEGDPDESDDEDISANDSDEEGEENNEGSDSDILDAVHGGVNVICKTMEKIRFNSNDISCSAENRNNVPDYFKNLPSVQTLDGLEWDKERILSAPTSRSTYGQTKIKERFQRTFSTPTISVLHFLPIQL